MRSSQSASGSPRSRHQAAFAGGNVGNILIETHVADAEALGGLKSQGRLGEQAHLGRLLGILAGGSPENDRDASMD